MAFRKKETLFSDNSIYLENENKVLNDSPLVLRNLVS